MEREYSDDEITQEFVHVAEPLPLAFRRYLHETAEYEIKIEKRKLYAGYVLLAIFSVILGTSIIAAIMSVS